MNSRPVYGGLVPRRISLARAKGRGSAGTCPDVAHASKTPAAQERPCRVAANGLAAVPPPRREPDASNRATAQRPREAIV